MGEISKIELEGETYDVKDETARDGISSLNDDLTNFKTKYGTVAAGSEIQFTATIIWLMVGFSSANYGLYGLYNNRIDTYAAGTNASFEVTADGSNTYTFRNNHTSSSLRYSAIIFGG